MQLLHNRLGGILLLVATALLWSTSGIGIKYVDWNPMAIASARSGIASIVIWAFFRKEKLTINPAILCGAAAYAVMMVAFVAANKLTTAANAILLEYTCPIFVAIIGAVFLKEKPALSDCLALGTASMGMLLFFQDQMGAGGLLGNLLGILAGFAMAIMAITMRHQKDGAPFGVVLLGNFFTFLVGIPFLFDGSPGFVGWEAIIALGCIQIGLAYTLYSLAIKQVTALESAIITMIEPILNPVWVFIFLGEKPGFWSLIGGGILLTAISIRYILPALSSVKKMKAAQ
ncbi:MAG: DMT family transporter [Pelosinus sp.]|nr:DMT family transporter [Pelosinus sp.]